MTTLVDLLSQTYAPIQGTMLPYFDIVDTLGLGRTCKRLKIELSLALKATRYNINCHLEKLFDKPVEFRSLQGSYGGLLYGDFARCFLACDTSKVMRLDITAGNPSNFHDYLIREEYSEDDKMANRLGIQVHVDEPTRRRRIGDKRTWVYNLDIAGVFRPARPDEILESTTFRLRTYGSGWNDVFSFYNLEFDDSIRHPILKHPFVVMEEDEDFDERSNTDPSRHELYKSHYSQMCSELKDHLDEQTMLELVNIPEAERPPQYQEYRASRDNAHGLRNKSTPPSTWTYFDEDVILFLAEA
ncbi:hypothetical protein G6514_009166 [Epicoccum nigrum]|nr:hypothetical protein G6514_009166 [Epicoccum nigrum]